MPDAQSGGCSHPTTPMTAWNTSPLDLPARTQVLVVGSGPAGSAAARTLALAGARVVLVDAQTFPRDKTCGDGLVPDTHAALRHLVQIGGSDLHLKVPSPPLVRADATLMEQAITNLVENARATAR